MVAVKGLKQQALVSWVQERHERGVQCPCRAGGHKDLCLRIDGELVEAGRLLRNGFAQRRYAIKASVDILPSPDGLGCGPGDGFRDLGITDTLRKVDAVNGCAGHRHRPDLGLEIARCEIAEAQRL